VFCVAGKVPFAQRLDSKILPMDKALGCDFFERVDVKRVDIKNFRNSEEVPVFVYFMFYVRFC
jgi:hypothetical protein